MVPVQRQAQQFSNMRKTTWHIEGLTVVIVVGVTGAIALVVLTAVAVAIPVTVAVRVAIALAAIAGVLTAVGLMVAGSRAGLLLADVVGKLTRRKG